jgi:hypothetical protein
MGFLFGGVISSNFMTNVGAADFPKYLQHLRLAGQSISLSLSSVFISALWLFPDLLPQ